MYKRFESQLNKCNLIKDVSALSCFTRIRRAGVCGDEPESVCPESKDPNEPCRISKEKIALSPDLAGKINPFLQPELATVVLKSKGNAAGLLSNEIMDRYLTALNKAIEQHNTQIKDASTKAELAVKDQSARCKKFDEGYLLRAAFKLETMPGKDIFGVRLVGVQEYICGDSSQAASKIPKEFVVSGVTNPVQEGCGEAYLKYAGTLDMTNARGFPEKVEFWKALSKKESDKLKLQPLKNLWTPCPNCKNFDLIGQLPQKRS